MKVVDTYPGAVKEDADEHGRDGEVVDEAADLKHEVELVRCRHKLKSFIPFILNIYLNHLVYLKYLYQT